MLHVPQDRETEVSAGWGSSFSEGWLIVIILMLVKIFFSVPYLTCLPNCPVREMPTGPWTHLSWFLPQDLCTCCLGFLLQSCAHCLFLLQVSAQMSPPLEAFFGLRN